MGGNREAVNSVSCKLWLYLLLMVAVYIVICRASYDVQYVGHVRVGEVRILQLVLPVLYRLYIPFPVILVFTVLSW